MKTKLLAVCASIAITMSMATGCASNGVMQRAKRDLSPIVGSAKVLDISILGADDENPYLLRFVIEFNRQVDDYADAFWSPIKGLDVNRQGIVIRDMDRHGYVKLVTLDLKRVKAMTGGIAAEFYIGQNNPISGYPGHKYFLIRERNNVPVIEKAKYVESTPLEVVVLNWNKDQQHYVEDWALPIDPVHE